MKYEQRIANCESRKDLKVQCNISVSLALLVLSRLKRWNTIHARESRWRREQERSLSPKALKRSSSSYRVRVISITIIIMVHLIFPLNTQKCGHAACCSFVFICNLFSSKCCLATNRKLPPKAFLYHSLNSTQLNQPNRVPFPHATNSFTLLLLMPLTTLATCLPTTTWEMKGVDNSINFYTKIVNEQTFAVLHSALCDRRRVRVSKYAKKEFAFFFFMQQCRNF